MSVEKNQKQYGRDSSADISALNLICAAPSFEKDALLSRTQKRLLLLNEPADSFQHEKCRDFSPAFSSPSIPEFLLGVLPAASQTLQ